jgi:predicted GH43/DUF377 family glycosyl hydrolase
MKKRARAFQDIIRRHPANPILTADDIPGGASSVFNSGLVRYQGKIVALLRVETRAGTQSIRYAESADGLKFDISDELMLVPTAEPHLTYEEAIYDPRITRIGDTYYVTYASENRFGCQVGLSRSKDLKHWEKMELIAEPDNRNIVLFPEKIKGLYCRLDRPFAGLQGGIWVSYSPDLVFWGIHRNIMESRRFSWDRGKIGPGAPPVETEAGWLVIYHGTTPYCNGLCYRLGLALLDLEDPTKVLGRPPQYLLSPREYYERVGDVPNVCFACAAIPSQDGEDLWIYYGGADQCLCLATARIADLLDACLTWK